MSHDNPTHPVDVVTDFDDDVPTVRYGTVNVPTEAFAPEATRVYVRGDRYAELLQYREEAWEWQAAYEALLQTHEDTIERYETIPDSWGHSDEWVR